MLSQNSLSSRPRTLIFAGLLGTAFALSAAPVQAQQSEIDLLRQQIAELQARLDKVEAGKIDAKPLTEKVGSSSKLPVTFGGLLQVAPLAYLDQDRTTGRLADTFRLRRGELRVTAPTITNNISGTVMFDLAKTNNLTNSGSVLQEIQISYNFDPNPKAPKFFDIGQFKPGFGFESDQVSSGALQLVERALFYSFRDLAAASAPTIDPDAGGPLGPVASGLPAPRPGGGLGDSRDQGARIRGTFANGTIAYNAGIFNGIGERQNGTAGGDAKAFVGRLIYRPANTGLQLGISGLQANTRGDVATTPLERDGYGAFLVYKKDKFTFQGEYAELKSARRNDANFFRNGTGYYGSLAYLIAPQFEVVGRYDTLDVDSRAGAATALANLKTTETTLGLNYYIKGNNAKIQTNLVKVNDNGPAASTADGLQLRANFQAAF